MSDRPLVFVIDHQIHPAGIENLKKKFEVKQFPFDVNEDELIAQGKECVGMFARRSSQSKKFFDNMPKLKIVARHGVGYDAVDIKAATENGVIVCANPENSNTVAEHTMALMMASVRNIVPANNALQDGVWDQKPLANASELMGKTLGIIGVGRIGSRVAKMAKAFNMTVIAYDPYVQDNRFKELGIKRVALDDLIAECDVLTLHCNLTPETKYVIDEKAFARMKDGVVIVNCSRGPTVKQTALLDALKSGKVRCAALDVTEQEPLPSENDVRGVANLILTPHMAALGAEVAVRSSISGAQRVIDELEGRKPNEIINPDAYNHRKNKK